MQRGGGMGSGINYIFGIEWVAHNPFSLQLNKLGKIRHLMDPTEPQKLWHIPGSVSNYFVELQYQIATKNSFQITICFHVKYLN